MKKWSMIIIPLMVLFIVPQITSGCFSFRMNEKELNDYFQKRAVSYKRLQYTSADRTINYVQVGENYSLPTVIFMHGAPGSLSTFVDFLTDTLLLQSFNMISIDRPGYGYSNFGKSEPSLEKQVALILPLLNNTRSPTILVGHSLGGAVIAKTAMNYPDKVDGLLFIAPSISSRLEPHEWYRKPLYSPLLRWIIPKSLRVTNDEIYFLKGELKLMSDQWKNINCPATVIQGGQDSLVDPGNADFAQHVMTGTKTRIIYLPEANHFLPWNNPSIIKSALLEIRADVYNHYSSSQSK